MKYIFRNFASNFTDKEKQENIEEIISFYDNEREEEIGLLSAHELFDFFVDILGPTIYNKAIQDTKQLLRSEMEEIDFKLDVLKK